jgi:VWFA-related protein
MSSWRAVVVVLVVCSAAGLAAQQQGQKPPTFTSRVTVVPVDVRVVDRAGKPITGLTAADFTITEDGVAQKIVHFSFTSLEAQAEAAPAPTLDFRKPLGETISPPTKRIFLIVLGRGRQVGPVKGVEAATKFIKERLLPQDQVALLAYNRATDFTSDHKTLVETLDRYWKKHEWIESRLRHHFSGLAAAHADPNEIPEFIQSEINAIFKAPGAVRSRSTDGATGTADDAQRTGDQRRERETLLRAQAVQERLNAGLSAGLDQRALDEAELVGAATFDEYVEKSFDTNVDLGNLYAGVRYLRMLDGEKHLVFISPNGLFLPRLEGANSLASLANDARVTIDIIHTYGTAPAQVMSARGVVRMAPAFGNTFQNSTSRQIATLTGGQMTSASAGDAFFRRLNDSTLSQYLLGYVPSNSTWDGKYRRIAVRVNRPGAQVLYRHGYIARNEAIPLDRQQYLMYSRIASALNLPRALNDVRIELGEPTVQGSGTQRALTVTLRILPGAVTLTQRDGHWLGKLEAVSFSADRNRRVVGELWHTIDVKITEENYQRYLREGVSAQMQMQLSGEPRYVKTVIYDYTADTVGSVMRELKTK